MKTFFTNNVQDMPVGSEVRILGWVGARRTHGNQVFIDIYDSRGKVQVVVNKDDSCFGNAIEVSPESSVEVIGQAQKSIGGRHKAMEIRATQVTLINKATIALEPKPRTIRNPFDERSTDHLLRNRHLYQRNSKMMAVTKFRAKLMRILHDWFFSQEFVEVHTPILTTVPLYDDCSVLSLNFGGGVAYLSQCAGFYLECMVHGLERIYNISPSFRGESSKSRRHLAEYWHVKAEMAWVTREDLLEFVERTMYNIIQRCQIDCIEELDILGAEIPLYAMQIPYPRITYRKAIQRLQEYSVDCEFGRSLGVEAEDRLAADFQRPFWITSIPRQIEPFPYVIDREDPECTMTADLVVPYGYGELLGVAEKIFDLRELDERMVEKGKTGDPRYNWVRQLREYGCVPHGGVGIGFERLIRWLISLGHVREAIAFPRALHRAIYP